jgi:hypothetical protein
VSEDALTALRRSIDGIDELPVDQRLEMFEQVNARLATELAALDEL